MSNLLQRTITGAIFGIVVIGSILLGKYTFAFLLLTICALGLKEFYKLSLSNANKKYSNIATLYGISVFVVFVASDLFFNEALHGLRYNYLFVAVVFGFVVFSILDIYKNIEPCAGKMLLGLLLVPISLISLWQISYYSSDLVFMEGTTSDFPDYIYNLKIPLLLLLLTWSNDVGAYFSGRFLGKRKLFERISPNKTWAGFYGGTVITILMIFIINIYFYQFTTLDTLLGFVKIILLGLIISTFATFGDLYQSYTKRIHGVKDSGKILPGHGGIWDRFDGFFFVIYGYLIFQFISATLF